jgi:hypothetical protein
MTIDEDDGELRQDRYPLRTAPQFIGPQLEDILAALNTITIECNSSTSNLYKYAPLPADRSRLYLISHRQPPRECGNQGGPSRWQFPSHGCY